LITTQSGPNMVKHERMRKATAPNRKGRKLAILSMRIDVEELLRNIEHEDLLENRKGVLDNLEMMEKALKELLYEESKGFNKECTILQTVLDLLTPKARNGWSGTSFNPLLQLLENIITKLNNLPTSTNHAKKIFSPLTLG
jgi:hypothetical protein